MPTQSRGFTLIEVLVYCVLFSMLLSGALMAAQTLIDTGNQTLGKNAVEEEGTFILQKISWMLMSATSIDVNSNGTQFTVVRASDSSFKMEDNPIIIKDTDNATVRIGRQGRASIPISATSVQVSDFKITVSHSMVAVHFVITSLVKGSLPTPFDAQFYVRS